MVSINRNRRGEVDEEAPLSKIQEYAVNIACLICYSLHLKDWAAFSCRFAVLHICFLYCFPSTTVTVQKKEKMNISGEKIKRC